MLVAPGQGMGGTMQNFNKPTIQTESHSGSAHSKTRFKSTAYDQNDMTMKKLWKQSTANTMGNPMGLRQRRGSDADAPPSQTRKGVDHLKGATLEKDGKYLCVKV